MKTPRNEKSNYKIIRFFNDGRASKIKETGLTLKEAQAHCQDPATRKEGLWFDGYSDRV